MCETEEIIKKLNEVAKSWERFARKNAGRVAFQVKGLKKADINLEQIAVIASCYLVCARELRECISSINKHIDLSSCKAGSEIT